MLRDNGVIGRGNVGGLSRDDLNGKGALGRGRIIQENYVQIAESGGQKRCMYYAYIRGLRGYVRQRKPH